MKNDAMQQPVTRKICGARSRQSGQPCRNHPMTGRSRCRMHGGKCGAKPGNKNALKTGLHTLEERMRIKAIRQLIIDTRQP